MIRVLSASFLLLASAVTQGALAADDPVIVPSPYTASLTPQEIAASSARQPQIAGATWNHEACADAYFYQARLEKQEQVYRGNEMALAQWRKDELSKGRPQGDVDAEAAKMRQQQDTRMQAIRDDLAGRTAAIPKCKGVFFRPALEDICSQYPTDVENRFCGLLKGGSLAGVSLSDDKYAFAETIAWSQTGALTARGTRFSIAPWGISNVKGFQQPNDGVIDKDGTRTVMTENGPRVILTRNAMLNSLRKQRAIWLDAGARAGANFIYSYAKAIRKTSTEPDVSTYGAWGVSLDMERGLRAEAYPETLALAQSLTAATGMPTDLGPDYIQLPRLHFQAALYDILVQSTYAQIAVKLEGGKEVALSAPASFREAPEGGTPIFSSSYGSYRIHATMMPTVADMQLLLRPDAKSVVVRFESMLEDGSIDFLTLETPLTGFKTGFDQMNEVNQGMKALMQQIAAHFDTQIDAEVRSYAAAQEKLAEARRASMMAAAADAREFIAANPFSVDCSKFPSFPASGVISDTSINDRLNSTRQCDKAWVAKVQKAIPALAEMDRRYKALGGTDGFIAAERARWQQALEARNDDLSRFNSEIVGYNERVVRHNAQASARQASASRYVPRRRNYRDNTDGGRDYAQEFYEAIHRPGPPMFRDVTVPAAPTGYMGTGYY